MATMRTSVRIAFALVLPLVAWGAMGQTSPGPAWIATLTVTVPAHPLDRDGIQGIERRRGTLSVGGGVRAFRSDNEFERPPQFVPPGPRSHGFDYDQDGKLDLGARGSNGPECAEHTRISGECARVSNALGERGIRRS